MTDARGAGPSRRSVLAGTGLLLIGACKGPRTVVVPRLTPDQRLARRVANEIAVLAAAYAATIAAHPKTRAALGPLAAEHHAHVAALVALLRAAPSDSPSPSGSISPSASPPVVAASAAEAVAALAAAERTAAARRRGQAGRAGPELARLLASIAACEAVHANLVKA